MGFFISSIILAAATIEQILARQIRVENQDAWDETLGPTIEKAEELDIISTKLACQADELRELRNGYIHYRDRSDEENSPSYVRDQNDKWGDALPFRIAEEDAEEAIEITIKIYGTIYDDVTIGEN